MLFDVPSSHPNYQNLINIERQIQRGTRLTSQLLGFAKREQSQIQVIRLNQLVAETAEAFGRTHKSISIVTDFALDLLPVEVDLAKIEQALLNLYLNAADAMPQGGEFKLKTMNVSHTSISGQPTAPRPGRYIQCSLSDCGEGMPKETLDQVFDPFFTTKETGPGSGLGLATVYSIINSHNGYIEVESVRGRGTTFHIYLPAADGQAVPDDVRSNQIVKGRGTILIVDDEEMVLEVGVQLLEKLGYRVIQAMNGEQAIALYQKHQDLIDLVILDIIMPGMDGAAVFDQLQQIQSEVKVLLASGYSIEGQATGILNRGGSGFIAKPFTLQQLSQKISALLPPEGNKAKK
jgi:CheY-like chemotaxis protein